MRAPVTPARQIDFEHIPVHGTSGSAYTTAANDVPARTRLSDKMSSPGSPPRSARWDLRSDRHGLRVGW